jgi:hypothetical protein
MQQFVASPRSWLLKQDIALAHLTSDNFGDRLAGEGYVYVLGKHGMIV